MSNRDFQPTASWSNLQRRAQLLRRIRQFFDDRGFLEVETPLLSADTVIDRHIDPLSVIVPDDPRTPNEGRRMWLQTSPEFAMKRLLAAGGEAIYQITRAFRAGESGALHNPEFTMVEWYRVGDTMQDGMQLLNELAEAIFERGTAERLSYREAFERHAGFNPLTANTRDIWRAAQQSCTSAPEEFAAFDRDGWLNLVLADCVEPHLGRERPTILYDYPPSQAALAIVRNEDSPVAERFELYVDGIELANGYHELCDADELLDRFKRTNEQRIADGKPPLPTDSRLLAAMRNGLPSCTGVALGFDRVVMLVAGAQSIAEVLPFPLDRA